VFRALIDTPACYLDVGFSHPPSAYVGKGEAVRLLKGNMSWVQTVARQVSFYLTGLLRSLKVM